MYNKVSTNLDFVEREKKTEAFWNENDIFRKSMKNREFSVLSCLYSDVPKCLLFNTLLFVIFLYFR